MILTLLVEFRFYSKLAIVITTAILLPVVNLALFIKSRRA